MNLWGEETCQKDQCTSANFCGLCLLSGKAHQNCDMVTVASYISHFLLLSLWMLLHFMLFPPLLWAASNRINQKFIAEWSFQMLTLPSKIFQGCHISILKRGHHNCTFVQLCIICYTGHHMICSLFTILYTNLGLCGTGFHRRPNG